MSATTIKQRAALLLILWQFTSHCPIEMVQEYFCTPAQNYQNLSPPAEDQQTQGNFAILPQQSLSVPIES